MVDLIPFPRFTQIEKERRWTAVRAAMEKAGLSAIVVPSHTGHSTDFQANARYLSHCGGGGDADICVVFPLAGDVTVASNSLQWLSVQDWVSDVRNAKRDYGSVIVDRLRELKLGGSRVGVTGLGVGTRSPEGTILYLRMMRLIREFPDVEFVDATELMEKIRLCKSDEEVEFLRESNRMIDFAYEAARKAAVPGATDYAVFAEAMSGMLREGSELPVHTSWVSGARPKEMLTLTKPSSTRKR